MATKKRAAAKPAPASAAVKPLVKHNGEPTREAKKTVNKTAFYKEKRAAKKVIEGVKEEAAKAVEARQKETPSIALTQTSVAAAWRKPHVEWTEQLAEDLYILISTGHSMEAIGKMEGMPSLYQQVCWLADKSHAYVDLRARAIQNLVPFYEEKIKELGISPKRSAIKTVKQVLDRDGNIRTVREKRYVDNVERSKLAVSVLQWTLGHLMPKKHGPRPDNTGEKANEQLEGLFAALKAGPKE